MQSNVIHRSHRADNCISQHQSRHKCLGRRLGYPRIVCSGEHLKAVQSLNGSKKPVYTNANFPVDAEGRTYHLGTKKGEVANRILSVGSTQRAQLLSKLLDTPAPGRELFQRLSGRGFLTITGRYQGVPVSIVSTHMGMPNMDFVVRENRAVVDGQMAIVRLGTCGAVQPPASLGNLLIASHGSIAVRRNPDAWSHTNGHAPYEVSLPVSSNTELSTLLVNESAAALGAENVVEGLNASADSFYSSQGRIGSYFDDRNEDLITQLCAKHPDLISLEMETFQLLDLARCSRGTIKGVGMCIALAERYSNAFMDYSKLEQYELRGGAAALGALAKCPLEHDVSMGAPPPQVLALPTLAPVVVGAGGAVQGQEAVVKTAEVQYVWS